MKRKRQMTYELNIDRWNHNLVDKWGSNLFDKHLLVNKFDFEVVVPGTLNHSRMSSKDIDSYCCLYYIFHIDFQHIYHMIDYEY